MKIETHSEVWRPCWVRGGEMEEIVWIGKDVLAWSMATCIVFFHVGQSREIIRWCPNPITGEGARHLSSHVSASIFAFSEKIWNPRILVFSYPSMTKISECSRGSPTGYLATAFTARDHLVSICAYPSFSLIVWSWKSGEKLHSVNTVIRDELGQILRVTQNGPTIIAQLGKACGQLFTWELDIVGKNVIVKDHEIGLPEGARSISIDWCPSVGSPLLAICDKDGHVYLSNEDGTHVRQIVLSQRCGVCLEVESPAICWLRGGIVLRTTFCQIRFYAMDPRTRAWRKQWYVKSTTRPRILVAHPFRNDRLFYHTLEGHLMQIDSPEDKDEPIVRGHLRYGSTYRFVDFVYPWGHHLAATDDLRDLVFLESTSGLEVSRAYPDMSGNISCQASHPDYPLIALTSLQGELVLVAILDPEEPRVLARMRLQREPLDMIKFSQSGR